MSRFRRVVSATFARPANTTQYAAADLVANSATAGSVVPLSFDPAARFPGGNGAVKAVRIAKSGVVLTAAAFKLHLFTDAPAVTNGDNGALAPTNGLAKGYLGAVAVTIGTAVGDGAFGRASCDLMFDTTKPSSKLYGLLEVTDVYTPGSAESFTVELELERE
ncbi:MAG: hypothetical protein V4475_01870 [Pseudomonadota bacterium]